MTQGVTRLAPSPTGALHLGNARTFVVNWLLARSHGWRVLLRVEDLDTPRTKPGAATDAIEDLRWLGLSWDGEVLYQSARHLVYQDALEQLIAAGAAYPCTCSRKDVEQAGGAPHAEDGESVYPGLCRGRWASADHAAKKSGRPVSWRVHVADEPIAFRDAFAGERQFNLAHTCGDFVIFRGDGTAAYQLAVVVDDAAAGVNQIVRGDDLLESAARQTHLRRLLGLAPEPTHWHLPLVVGGDGRRLAKRHGDTRLSHYRDGGTTSQRVLGLIGHWCGLLDRRREASMDELQAAFDPARISRRQVVFTAADDAFLRS